MPAALAASREAVRGHAQGIQETVRGRAYARSMNLPRIAGAAALGVAAILTLSGCIQLPTPQAPVPPANPGATAPATSAPAADPRAALIDTQWSGSAVGTSSTINLVFTFEADGTLYITTWNDETGVPFDDASDTWSLNGSTLEITLSNIREIETIDFSGTVSGSSPIAMTGVDGAGTGGYTLTLTQG